MKLVGFVRKQKFFLNTKASFPKAGMCTKLKIYTKTGDKGTSSLFNGERLSKQSEYFEALGNADELNAQLGVALEHCLRIKYSSGNADVSDKLETLQSALLELGSCIATPKHRSKPEQLERAKFEPERVEMLEKWIDTLDSQLPPLRNFILPSGGLASSSLHVARAVCRRLERSLVPLKDSGALEETPYKFVNRLSDFLFVAARFAAKSEGKEERVHKPVKKSESQK